jgi:hypothetical protein
MSLNSFSLDKIEAVFALKAEGRGQRAEIALW